MDHRIIARKGGNKTLEKYGREHFSAIGKRGAEAKVRIFGPDYFTKLSALGVAARKAKLNLPS
ncbi:MAG: hypothetical protein AAB706_02480 [Patescibacteria group bacterium]